jgi:hypothetical protein
MSGVGIGLRARRGGAVVAAVSLEAGEPRLLQSTFLATAAEGDRLAFEPYQVAYEMARGPDGEASAEAAAAVAEGRRRQDALAAKGLAEIAAVLPQTGGEAPICALLVNRAGWISDLLQYSLWSPEHPLVAEGLAVRDALRSAFKACGLEAVEMDEKSLPQAAELKLPAPAGAIEARLKALGAGAGPPWRSEQKAACLAAWLALAGRG